MLEDVVSHGTASNAKIPGYRIGGKTGTAQKSINGKYSKQNFISSFIGVFPIDNPKFVCVVSVDSPDYNRGKHWGNETAAPIVKDIFERIIINNNYYKNNNFINDEHLVDNISELIDGSQQLNTKNILIKNQTLIPSFSGLTLKQSIKEAKLSGLILNPAGISSKAVWQSIPPVKNINNASICTIKLETM